MIKNLARIDQLFTWFIKWGKTMTFKGDSLWEPEDTGFFIGGEG